MSTGGPPNKLGYYWWLLEVDGAALRGYSVLRTVLQLLLFALELLSSNRKSPRKKREWHTNDTRVPSPRGVFDLFALGMLIRQSQGLWSLLGRRENPAVIYL